VRRGRFVALACRGAARSYMVKGMQAREGKC
jgi:hypothetical protein